MKSYGGVEVQLHSFLTLAPDGTKRSISDSVGFTPGEEAHVTHCIRVNVGPRAGLKIAEKKKFFPLPRELNTILWPRIP